MTRSLLRMWSRTSTMIWMRSLLMLIWFVVMVKHTEIRENVDKLAGKVILDCHNIIDLPGVYHI